MQRNKVAKRAAQRSKKGCRECRQRKMKCDERNPRCFNCERTGRVCHIADAPFRLHHFSLAAVEATTISRDDQSAHEASERGALYLVTPSSADSRPHRHESRPATQDGDDNDMNQDRHGLLEWTAERSPDHGLRRDYGEGPPDIIRPSSNPYVARSQHDELPEFATTMSMNGSSPVEASTTVSYVNDQTSPYTVVESTTLDNGNRNDDSLESRESSIFLRQFAETLADAFDIFCHDQYFRRQVLVQARTSDLVRFAACAAAAKRYGHIRHASHIPNIHGNLRAMGNDGQVDYLWYGAKYYGKAIQSMAAHLLNKTASAHDLSPSAIPWSAGAITEPSSSRCENLTRLSSALMMCQYEQLSASIKAWSRHLDGILNLLRLGDIDWSRLELCHSSPSSQIGSSVPLSVFWSFVRNDIEESYISSCPTRVDVADLKLWQSMGLPVDESGSFLPDSFRAMNERNDDWMVGALHALLWLLCRVLTLIATEMRPARTSTGSPCTFVDEPGHRTEEWSNVDRMVRLWRTEVGDAIQPDLVQLRGSAADEYVSDMISEEIWFASNTSALAALYWNMASILLLLNRPYTLVQSSTSVHGHHPYQDWLLMHRSLQSETSLFAKQTIAIAQGRPNAAVRMHTLQPLYLAGRCLWRESDQRALVLMLRDLEREMGVATGYRVASLANEWGWNMLNDASALDAELSDLSSE